MREPPEVDHFFSEEILEDFHSVVFEAPEEKHATIEEGIRLDLARVTSWVLNADKLFDACDRRVDLTESFKETVHVGSISDILREDVVKW